MRVALWRVSDRRSGGAACFLGRTGEWPAGWGGGTPTVAVWRLRRDDRKWLPSGMVTERPFPNRWVGEWLAAPLRTVSGNFIQPCRSQTEGCGSCGAVGGFSPTGTFFVGFFFRSFIFNRFLPRCRPPPAGALATTMGIDFSLPTTREAKKYVSVGGFPWATVVNFEQC